MEPEDSLLCSQESTAGSYPKTDASVHSPNLFKTHSDIIFQSMPKTSKWSLPFFRFCNHDFNGLLIPLIRATFSAHLILQCVEFYVEMKFFHTKDRETQKL